MELSQIEEVHALSEDLSSELSRVHSDLKPWVRVQADDLLRSGKWENVLDLSKGQQGTQGKEMAESFAMQLYEELLKLLDKKLNEEEAPKKRESMRQTIFQNIQERFRASPLKLVETVVNCLQQEKFLWNAYCEQKIYNGIEMESSDKEVNGLSPGVEGVASPAVYAYCNSATESLSLKIVHLKSQVDTVEKELDNLKIADNNYKADMPTIEDQMNQLRSYMEKNGVSTGAEESGVKEALSQLTAGHSHLVQAVKDSRKKFMGAVEASCLKVKEVFPLLDKEVKKWKEQQKMFYLKLADEPLQELQQLSQWYADVGDKLFFLLQMLAKCRKFWTVAIKDESSLKTQLDVIENFTGLVKTNLSKLIQRSAVQTIQPPNIIQVTSSKSSPGTSRPFPAKIRVLALEKASMIPISSEITARLVSESELNNEVCQKKISLELHQGTSTLEKKKSGVYDLVEAPFDSLQVRKFKRPKRARKTTASGPDQLFVCEQKFRLVFTGSFSVPKYLDDVTLRVVSLPVTITTNSSQESDCSAALLWQCYHTDSDNDHGPYTWPDNVPWPQVSAMLNTKWEVETGRALPDDQMRYLGDKLNGGEPNDGSYENMKISWARFAKEKMEKRDFTFWRWFHASMNIIKYHMKEEWIDGRIYGFLSRSKTKELLRPHPPGVFLLRISESNVSDSGPHITGGVSAAVMTKAPGRPVKSVNHIDPYTIKELDLHGTVGQVLAFTEAPMTTLFPEMIPKEEAFKKYKNTKDSRGVSQNDGYNMYLGLTIHFKLDLLSISNDTETEFEDEAESSMEGEGGGSGSWTTDTTIFSPASCQSADTVFSPGAISPPVPSPQQQQQHNHGDHGMPILTTLLAHNGGLCGDAVHSSPDHGFQGQTTQPGTMTTVIPENLLLSDTTPGPLLDQPFELDQFADPNSRVATYRELDGGTIHTEPGQPAFEVFTDVGLFDGRCDLQNITPTFDPHNMGLVSDE